MQTFQCSEDVGAQPRNRGAAQEGHKDTKGMCALLGLLLCHLEVQNMLEHGKKGICLGDSDMFQHFPTGSCTSQNNCNPGSCPLAYDYVCITLQSGGHTHTGAAGMPSPRRSSVLHGWRKRKHRDHNMKKCQLAGIIQTTNQGRGQRLPFIDGEKKAQRGNQFA